MAYEPKEGDISIFKNKEKKQEKSPDYWGKLRLNGEDCKVALWVREGKNGKFMSGTVTLPEGKIARITDAPQPPEDIPIPDEDDDDFPF
jgi:hypothetical protein